MEIQQTRFGLSVDAAETSLSLVYYPTHVLNGRSIFLPGPPVWGKGFIRPISPHDSTVVGAEKQATH